MVSFRYKTSLTDYSGGSATEFHRVPGYWNCQDLYRKNTGMQEKNKNLKKFLTSSIKTDSVSKSRKWDREAGVNPARPSHCDRVRKLQCLPLAGMSGRLRQVG